jgi:hypothetical protein
MVVVLLLGAAGLLGACGDGGPTRQQEVAERGAQVMPFDLDATMHRFTPVPGGLDQVVVADNPSDATQIGLIREHLEAAMGRFQRGGFDDPARIHGDDMPGLAALRAGAARIDIGYEELPDGARLRYRADDPDLVAALHAWGDAQVRDHGAHAEHGGNGHGHDGTGG